MAEFSNKGVSKAEIARRLKRAKSTIADELKLNSVARIYRPITAHRKARARRRERPQRKMDSDTMAHYVKEWLWKNHSPELISGRLKQWRKRFLIGRQTIYNWIHAERSKGRTWHRHLPRRGKAYHHPCSGSTRWHKVKTIYERPAVGEARCRFGDWEADTLEGRKGGAAVITLVERKSRFTLLCPVAERSVAALIDAVKQRFALTRHYPRETVTVDRGSEFSDGIGLEKAMKAAVYFADPHSPW